MKGNFLKNCLFYVFFPLSTWIVCSNCVSLQTNKTNEEILRSNVSFNRTQAVITTMKCKGTHVDGTSYLKPCRPETITPTVKPPIIVTDSEVSELTKSHIHLPSTTQNIQLNISSTLPPTTSKTSDLEIDVIEKPEEYWHPNNKFNLTTGGIAALICSTAALSFYLSVMMWKRIVMNAYQNREILLNDDDIGDINDEDMRHFELKFLDKDGRVVESAN